jgi:hypothetical protein
MSGLTLGNDPPLILMEDLISKGDHPFVDSFQPSPDNNDFIISGRIPIPARDIAHNEFISEGL